MLCEPTLSVLIVSVAVPVLLSVAVPSCVVPSMKLTLPAGTLAPETVAVSVTLLCASTVDALVCTVVEVVSPTLTPVPLRLIVCVAFATLRALSVSTREPPMEPLACGRKLIA